MENKSIPTVIDLKRIIKGFAAEVESLQKKYHVSQRQAEEISRSHGQLAARTSELEASHEQLARSNQQLENENRFLTEQVRLLRSGLFGKKSEAYPAQMPELFDEAEMASQKESVSGGLEIRYTRSGKPRRQALPEYLPREEVVIELAESERKCGEGHELQEIGAEISEQLDIEPARVKVKRIIRKKYACPICEGVLKTAPPLPTAIPKSIAGAGLLSHILVSKYVDALPLYRMEEILSRSQIEISRSSMATWMIQVGKLLTPLWNLLNDELLESRYVSCDETRVQVLKEEGKKAQSLSYMWVRARGGPSPPIILYNYAPSRSGGIALSIWEGYSGYLQVDGYEGYNAICSRPEVTRVGCWAHVRRKFYEAAKASRKGISLAEEALGMIQRMYRIESQARELSAELRQQKRAQEAKPILDQFKAWLESHQGSMPPQSLLGKALGYAWNQWSTLTVFIEDGNLAIDNNRVENAIRPFAIGRKNWLFSDSVSGAEASSIIYSLVQSARANGLKLFPYFKTILEKIPYAKTIDDFDKLLPHKISLLSK
jgi:transposase